MKRQIKSPNELSEKRWLNEMIKEIENNAPNLVPKDSILIFLYCRRRK